MAARAEAIVDLKQTPGARKRTDRRMQAVRGGRSSQPAAPTKRHWRRWAVLALVAGGLIGAGGWALKHYAASFAVQHVEIRGEFHNEQARAIKQALLPYVKGDFFTVDLTAARRSVTALEWVDGASLRRQWPNRVVVDIDEQVPVARWNDTAFINPRGEVFAKAYGADPRTLPSIHGPDGSAAEVQQRFAALQSLAGEYERAVDTLRLDRRDTWTLELREGPVLRLGGQALEARLRRFFEVMAAGQGPELAAVEAVDLRYSNGFAVDWKAGRGPDKPIDSKEAQQDV